MSFTIYAMRAKGEIEVRYIGQTAKTPESRIIAETAQSSTRARRGWGAGIYPMDCWLLANDIEGVVLATAATKAEACAKEREMVEAFARLGHRLFNRWLVPTELRQAA